MDHPDGKFLHESLQDRKSVKALLEALTKAIGKGELTLNDDDNALTLPLDKLLSLMIKADRTDGRCSVDIRLTWTEQASAAAKKTNPSVS
ncbi:amphi-Trp domain-containing protein [Epibacterium ulvae]|uniref:amphi-Trp domain-containing protein n=1 Tax=Epibacterium ulvae TaxID=1156985 RepID=UPI001BFC0EAC|nr:amphi-Trp domain-containing protein [Epibacterium ulvae]MBT8153453.1 amphi-Trp domain-containing protein [Epibacterium ulvae]